jgi:hypothetical protein
MDATGTLAQAGLLAVQAKRVTGGVGPHVVSQLRGSIPPGSRWVGVYLSVVKTRNGARYYSKMSVEFSVSGKLRWESGTYQSGWWGSFPQRLAMVLSPPWTRISPA